MASSTASPSTSPPRRARLRVSHPLDPAGMLKRWRAEFDGGADPLALVEQMLAESTVVHHPAYVGHQLAAPLPLTALGSLVVAIVNGSGAIYELSQAGGACELALSKHLTARLSMPTTAGGMIVHGGTIATLTALLAARQAQAGFDVWRDGAHGGPPLALLASDQTHYSTARAAQIMGFGESGAISVASDERFRMRPDALAEEIAAARARGQRPVAVVASAGTTATGAFDPLEEIAGICEAEGLWLHVDAAHGGSASLSPKLAPQLAGIGRADSVVWDLHKTLPFPALCSLLAYARTRDAYGAFAQKADYLFRSGDAGDENMGTRTSSARARSSRWSPTSASRRSGATGCASTSSGSGSSGRSSPASCARAATSSLRWSRSATSSASATAARRAPTPTRIRSASAAPSTRAASSTSCRRSCAG